VEILLAGEYLSGRRDVGRKLGRLPPRPKVNVRRDDHVRLAHDQDVLEDPVGDREELRGVGALRSGEGFS
jgi:hypothetical protein